jgi:hypothetical protein
VRRQGRRAGRSARVRVLKSPLRSSARPLAGLLAVLLAALSFAGCSSGAGGTTTTTGAPTTEGPTVVPTTEGPTTAQQVYDKTLANVGRASSVHYVATSTGTSSEGTTRLQFVADVGKDNGSQVTSWIGVNQKGSFTVVVIGAATYLKADADSLATFFGAIPATKANAYAERWISFAPSDKLYSSLRGDLTVSAVATSLEFDPTTEAPGSGGSIVINGRPKTTTKVPAGEKASTSMTVSNVTYLPEKQAFSASDNGATDTSSIQFSQWGAATVAPAPAASITWASVAAAIAPPPTTAPAG